MAPPGLTWRASLAALGWLWEHPGRGGCRSLTTEAFGEYPRPRGHSANASGADGVRCGGQTRAAMAAPTPPDLAAAPPLVPLRRSSFTPRDAGLLVLLALLWGHSFLFVKTAVATIPPVWIVALRMAVGGLLLLAIVAVLATRTRLRRAVTGDLRFALPRGPRMLVTLVLIGLVGTAFGWLAQSWAQQFLDSGLVAVLNATTPAATLGIAVAVGQERLHTSRVVGLAVAIVGTVIVIGGEVGGGSSLTALVVAVVATCSYGIGAVWMRARISGVVAPLPAAAVQIVGAALVLAPVALLTSGAPPTPVAAGLAPTLSILALGIGGSATAFLIYNTLIASVGATNAAMVTYLVPIVGLVSGALVRGERFGPNVLLGAAVLIAGVWLAQRRPLEAPPEPEADESPIAVVG